MKITPGTSSGGSGTPGGSTTQVQYNNAGAFGGASGLTTDGTHLTQTSSKLIQTGNISAAAWTTNGLRIAQAAATLTDTSSSGTVALIYANLFGSPTLAASSVTTYTNAYGAYFADPVAGTNVTLTNKYALAVGGNVALGTNKIASDQGPGSQYIGWPSGGGTAFTISHYGSSLTFNSTDLSVQSSNIKFGSSTNVILNAKGAANLQFGAADAASPVAQIQSVQSVVAGTTNIAGAVWTHKGSQGTGTGLGGDIIFQTAPAGTTGTAQNALVSVLTIAAVGTFGYATGSGGAVTQITSRTTGVTLNKACGAITLVSAAGSTAIQSFTVTNSMVAATDTINICQKSGTDLHRIYITNVAAGSFQVSYATLAGTTIEQPVFNFAVVAAKTA